MARQIIWNKRAIDSVDEIIEYLDQHATPQQIGKFISKLDDTIQKLNKYPEIGRRTKNKKTVRQYKLDKNRNIYYRKYGNKLIIVLIFD